MLIAEAARFPALVSRTFDHSIGPFNTLTLRLLRAALTSGQLRLGDPERLFGQLTGLLTGWPHQQALLGRDVLPTGSAARPILRLGVDAVLDRCGRYARHAKRLTLMCVSSSTMGTASLVAIAVLAIALFATCASTPVSAADLFYMDHDPMTNTYTGAIGPLVVSGEIVPGDYDHVLQKIAGNQPRFFEQNKIIIAAESGDLLEAMKIADLVKALYSAVTVGPFTGRCLSACLLIYTAATQRATDGAHLLGLEHPAVEASVAEKAQAFLGTERCAAVSVGRNVSQRSVWHVRAQ